MCYTGGMIQSLYRVPDYTQEKVSAAVRAIMEDHDIRSKVSPGMKVVLKPNLIMAKSPQFPVTTHPAVVRAVAQYLRSIGVTDIVLAESSGGPYTAEYMKGVYRTCGMEALKDVLTLNDDFSSVPVACKSGFKNHSFNIIRPVVQADFLINICKLKTHAMTGYSGGIKNLFGVIPGLEKAQMHYRWPDIEDFSTMLLELAQTVHPGLTIIDAIDAMEGNGPTGGTAHPLGLLLGAEDFFTQDYFALSLMQMEPESVVMIRQAVEQGLARPAELELKGDAVPEGLTAFKLPDTVALDFSDSLPGVFGKLFVKIASRILKSYPQVDKEKCIGCARCQESCPSHIIRMEGGKAVFRKKGCISCFCCQEMCPRQAIYVKKAL